MRAAAVFTQKFVAANLGLLSMARDLGLLPIERHNRNWKRWCEAFVIQLGSPVDLCQHTFSLFMLYDDSFIHFIRLHSGSFWYITNNTHWKSWYHPFYVQMLYNSHLFFWLWWEFSFLSLCCSTLVSGYFCVTDDISGHWPRILGDEKTWELFGSVSHLHLGLRKKRFFWGVLNGADFFVEVFFVKILGWWKKNRWKEDKNI